MFPRQHLHLLTSPTLSSSNLFAFKLPTYLSLLFLDMQLPQSSVNWQHPTNLKANSLYLTLSSSDSTGMGVQIQHVTTDRVLASKVSLSYLLYLRVSLRG